MTAVYLNAMGVSCAIGDGAALVRDRLFAEQRHPLSRTDRYTPGQMLHLGALPHEPTPLDDDVPRQQRSRNNALLRSTLAQLRMPVQRAIDRHGPQRVAVVLGISTGGVAEGECAAEQQRQARTWPPAYDYAQQEMGNGAAFVARELGVRGACHVISTACSSGAKALASAARLLRAGIADAVVAGGADTLCRLTIAGFGALEAVSPDVCNPLSIRRSGINLGEGAALFLMTRESAPVRLAGWGETSDAHHISAPEPSGRGAAAAMGQALSRAGASARAVDYVNLHGTATPLNDAMECRAVAEVLGLDVPVSSTKPLTGHALAAAGAVEAAFAYLTLVDNPLGKLPPHWWDGEYDPALARLQVVRAGQVLGRAPRFVLSNSFAFGGSNASLLLAAE